MNKKATPEEITEALYKAELAVVRAERRMERNIDPEAQIELMKDLIRSIDELKLINEDIGDDFPINIRVV